MSSLQIRKAEDVELTLVAEMQEKYNRRNLDPDTKARDGFLSLLTDFLSLKELNDGLGVIIAMVDGDLVGFEIPVTLEQCDRVPLFVPLKKQLMDSVVSGVKLNASNTMIGGQICVDKRFHSLGIGEAMHTYLIENFKQKYEFLAVEIDHMNTRSLHFSQAHLGLTEILKYQAFGTTWHVLVQNMKQATLPKTYDPFCATLQNRNK